MFSSFLMFSDRLAVKDHDVVSAVRIEMIGHDVASLSAVIIA